MATSAVGKSRFLELQALAALEHTRFTTRQRIDGAYSGRHRSRQLGGAHEFVDYREYSDGEDLRRLDWKVLARTDRAYVRVYQDETNLLCTLAIDASASMNFAGYQAKGSPGSKLEYAQYLTTALSHLIGRGQDQVGLAVLGEKLREFLPSGGTTTHLTRLQEIIEQVSTEPSTNMAESLRMLFERVKRRGVLVLASDFLVEDLEELFAALRLFRHRQWEVLLLHVIHPDEERMPEGTAYRFEGLENEGSINCSPTEVRDLYEQRFQSHVASVRALALAAGCEYRLASTAIGYLPMLRTLLVERAG